MKYLTVQREISTNITTTTKLIIFTFTTLKKKGTLFNRSKENDYKDTSNTTSIKKQQAEQRTSKVSKE